MSDSYDYTPLFRELGRNLTQVSGQIQAVSSQVVAVDQSVGVVSQDLSTTRSDLAELRSRFEEFVDQAARQAAVQQSETKVGNLRAQLDREFGHYSVVRRTSVGMLHAFDLGNVSNQTVQSVSEELMIQSPRYWLAPALVALAAWSRDNRELAEKSVRAAFERDPNKTSLFFALVLRRQGRTSTAVRWLRHYLTSFDPRALTREFAVILEATSYDAFGPEGQSLLASTVDSWCQELRRDDVVNEQQAKRWFGEIGVHRQALDEDQFPALRAVSPDFDKVLRQLERASALPAVLAKYTAVRDHAETMPTSLEDLLDDILDVLVSEYDEVELPLRREVLYHESVIAENGQLDRARLKAESLTKALEETMDVVTLQTNSAIDPAGLGVSARTQRLAVGVGHRDFSTALGRYCRSYRQEYVDAVGLEFGDQHSNYARSLGFPGVQLSTATPEVDGVRRITEAWARAVEDAVKEASFNPTWYVVPGAAVAGGAVLGMVIGGVIGVLLALVGAAVVFGLGESKKRKCAADVARLRDSEGRAREVSINLYRDALAEFVDARLTFEELDSQEDDVLRLIETWPTRSPGSADPATDLVGA